MTKEYIYIYIYICKIHGHMLRYSLRNRLLHIVGLKK